MAVVNFWISLIEGFAKGAEPHYLMCDPTHPKILKPKE